jgi:hypothetical protein
LKIICDTREHQKELERIQRQFDRLGVDYIRSKLSVGDYMSESMPNVSIDRKKTYKSYVAMSHNNISVFRQNLTEQSRKVHILSSYVSTVMALRALQMFTSGIIQDLIGPNG